MKRILLISAALLTALTISSCKCEEKAEKTTGIDNETIQTIAAAHGVSAAQVILRWDLQRGIVVIPGSSNPEHIRENLDLFGFELSDDEMGQIAALDRGEKHDWY